MSETEIPKTIYNTKITVKDVEYNEDSQWEKYNLFFEPRKTFIVDVCVNEKEVYLKPTRPYYSAEFEKLFNFGIGCKFYDEKKVIKVVSPGDYFKIFNNES